MAKLPLRIGLGTRDGTMSKDDRAQNVIFEILGEGEESSLVIHKRPGIEVYEDDVAGTGYGLYNWRGTIYGVWDGTLYKDNGAGVFSSVGTVNEPTTDGTAYFAEYTDSSSVNYLVVKCDNTLYQVKTDDTITEVTDSDLAGQLLPGLASINGYICVLNPKGELGSSANGDVMTWNALDYTTADSAGDKKTFVVRHLETVLVMGWRSIEFFQDTGNSTGSPFSKAGIYKSEIGCGAPRTVWQNGKDLFLVANHAAHGYIVARLVGYQYEIISTPAVQRILGREADIASLKATGMHVHGHQLYMIHLSTGTGSLVYDATSSSWSVWEYNSSNTFPCDWVVNLDEDIVGLDSSSGTVFKIKSSLYRDEILAAEGTHANIDVELRTRAIDLGSMKNDFLHRLELYADETSATSTISVEQSFDDYQTWDTARNIDLVDTVKELTRMGRGRRRAFRLKYADNYPLRITAIELDDGGGQH